MATAKNSNEMLIVASADTGYVDRKKSTLKMRKEQSAQF